MDILVKSVLDYVQSQKGHVNSVVAGGSVRDEVLGLTPKDYDIVIPSRTGKDIDDLAMSLSKEFGVSPVLKTKQYTAGKKKKTLNISTGGNLQRLTHVWNINFEGKDIDLIGHRFDDDEEFPTNVIERFDYGINMAYDTGTFIYEDNVNFKMDTQWGQMTLINLEEISYLPNAISRYKRVNDKYFMKYKTNLSFRASCLKLDRKKEEDTDIKGSFKKALYDYETEGNNVWDNHIYNTPAPQAQQTALGAGGHTHHIPTTANYFTLYGGTNPASEIPMAAPTPAPTWDQVVDNNINALFASLDN